ncbi:MAG: heme exporter protein CcmD [Xanthomonadaceae bacterium]|nr:heme exporter protein CcmD [Xanthomonadaceae bacterium]
MIPEFSHAAYVWASYGIFAVVVLWQWIQPLVRRRRILDALTEARAEQRAARELSTGAQR